MSLSARGRYFANIHSIKSSIKNNDAFLNEASLWTISIAAVVVSLQEGGNIPESKMGLKIVTSWVS